MEMYRRKLSAVLSADVEGYSRLIQEDEELTIRTLTTYREAIRLLVQQYRGRIVDTPGDNILAEFISAVEAVNCAAEIQREIAERNAKLPERCRMNFRIGINLGDIVEGDGKIYGDGVNIAARMESIAEGGGICISGSVYDAVENKIGLAYEYLGEKEVKNILKPVRAYRVLSFPGAAAHRVIRAKRLMGKKWLMVMLIALCVGAAAIVIWSVYFHHPPFLTETPEETSMALPVKPSIAVLPFENMSGDTNQEYLSDGITESVITTLSKIPDLFVIARNSSFIYKGKPVKVQKVSEELGVRYVLEGSVQKTSDRIRITVQLIDAQTGSHVWAERYDRKMKDIFSIQDEITIEITRALRIELLEGEQARLWGAKETKNLKAYEIALQARAFSNRGTKQDNARARQLYEEAIALDSEFVSAYSALGWTHFWDARFGWSDSKQDSLNCAFDLAQEAIQHDEELEDGHLLLAAIYLLRQEWEQALSEAQRASALNPNGADAYSVLAGIVSCVGRWEEGILYVEKAIRLNPFPPVHYFHWLGRAYFMTGQYEKSISVWHRALRVNPDYLPAHSFLAACYISLGREKEAASAAAEVMRIDPEFRVESYAEILPYKNRVDRERELSALREAGLPQK